MQTTQDPIFTPFQLGSLQLNNRLVMAPMTRSHSPNGVPTEAVAAYYQRRAAGGVGLIITEGTTINHPSANGYADIPRFHGEDALNGWQRVVEQVHAAGAKIMPQLWHVGAIRRPGTEPDVTQPGVGPMDIYEDGQLVVRGLDQDEIAEIVAAYAQAAADAQALGFDGVELHGAHEYLIDQFLWQTTNQRQDQYGGSLSNRSRFAKEIVTAVRAAVGPDFPIILRISQWKQQDYQAQIATTPEQLSSLLTPIVAAGVDIVHASTRRFWEPAFSGSELNLAGWVKQLTGKPSISVGSVGLNKQFSFEMFSGQEAPEAQTTDDLEQLRERLARNEFDLMAVGRALLADPQWPNKIQHGQQAHIAPFTKRALNELL